MNVNYSSWCWRTATIGGRRELVCPQTNTDKHEFPGRFNHKPRVRDRDHIDHKETGMKASDLTGGRGENGGVCGLPILWEGHGPPSLSESPACGTWRFAKENGVSAKRRLRCDLGVGEWLGRRARSGCCACPPSLRSPACGTWRFAKRAQARFAKRVLAHCHHGPNGRPGLANDPPRPGGIFIFLRPCARPPFGPGPGNSTHPLASSRVLSGYFYFFHVCAPVFADGVLADCHHAHGARQGHGKGRI
ncbi:MAG: hypothetical protein JWR26_2845 [Pedosphaera sp.]|nr:hypothetical protein [Pedosphaera sp.]